MQTIQLRNGTIRVYDSIKQLPIIRYNQLNHFLAQELGIGADGTALTRHFGKLDAFLASGDINAARQERINLGYNMHMMLNEIDIKSRVFLALVAEINGEPVGDLDDDDACEKALSLLSNTGITVGDVEDYFEDAKKKLMPS